MYTLFEIPEPSAKLGCWERPLGKLSEVIGYSHLGSFFVRDPRTRTYVVLHPLSVGNNAKNYGKFESAADFESTVLKSRSFVDEILRPEVLSQLATRLGELDPEQVYYPVPYPFLGGSGKLDTYDKGDVWVFADLVGQTLGVE